MRKTGLEVYFKAQSSLTSFLRHHFAAKLTPAHQARFNTFVSAQNQIFCFYLLERAKFTKDVNDLILEAGIMSHFIHDNVLRIIGLNFHNIRMPRVILPFMSNGDSLHYIRDPLNDLNVRQLVSFGIGVAKGMCYMAEKRFIHRDIAARNCM